jgi:hypothetical protein
MTSLHQYIVAVNVLILLLQSEAISALFDLELYYGNHDIYDTILLRASKDITIKIKAGIYDTVVWYLLLVEGFRSD